MLINFHMGVTLRCYGNVEIEAESVEAALPLLTADYIAGHIEIKETTTDSGQDLAVIDASDAITGKELADWGGYSLPSPYDPPAVLSGVALLESIKAPAGMVDAARMGHAALKLARDCFRSACAERTLERVVHALSSAKGAVRHAENKAVRS